jgi:hypothetical protein
LRKIDDNEMIIPIIYRPAQQSLLHVSLSYLANQFAINSLDGMLSQDWNLFFFKWPWFKMTRTNFYC